jgi:membrane-bound inhibitor of C-type lysozyme
MRGAVIGSMLGMLAILASSPALAARQRAFSYRCDDGTALTATFSQKPAKVTLRLGAKTLVLPQGRSGSGARYVKGRTVFWIKGRDAAFDRGRRSTTCHTDESQ